MQRVIVLFKLIGGNDDVVTAEQVHADFFVVSNQTIRDARVFITMVEKYPVTTVFADGHAVDVNFVDPAGFDSVAALLISSHTKMGESDSPEVIFVFQRVF